MQPINSQATRSQEVTRLDKYTEYEFQILAFTSVGDGPKSTVVYEKTKEAGKKQESNYFYKIQKFMDATNVSIEWYLT